MTETKTTHTPGPWTADVTDWPLVVNDAREDVIATIPESESRYSRQAEANARLIAAAPELLDALTGLLAVYDQHLAGMGTPEARTARLLLQRVRLLEVAAKTEWD